MIFDLISDPDPDAFKMKFCAIVALLAVGIALRGVMGRVLRATGLN